VSPATDSPLSGAGLDDGIKALRATGVEPWWFARSMFLCNGCDAAEPRLGFAPSAGPQVTPRADGRVAVFGFRWNRAMQAWADRHGAAVAMPAPKLTRMVGDKTRLPELARDAGVEVPRSVTSMAARADDAEAMWRELGADRAVAQLAENDLTGTGTRLIESPAQLTAALADWKGRAIKLAAFAKGLPITVSGVVFCAEATVVSGVSMQLVGYHELTPVWGAHCGNQLLDDAHLPPGAGAAAREACCRLGTVLGRAGYRGMFGADGIVTDTGILLFEINPRVQSVTSLISCAELAAGLLPSPLLHLLAFVGPARPAPFPQTAGPPPPFGQLVVSTRAPGRLRSMPRTGVYRWPRTALEAAPEFVGGPAPLCALRPDEALVWALAEIGTDVAGADRLFVIQTPGPVARCPDGALTPAAVAWLAALRHQTVLDATTKGATA
jgi:ATP-grasp domain